MTCCPSSREQGLVLHPRTADLRREERERLDAYFHANVFPVLTPLAVDPGHPFPYISNLSLSLAVVLRGADGEERFARVKVPKILPRWVPLIAPNEFVPLEEVIGANLESLFPGVEILGWYTFRITRNTDLQIADDDEADDLLSLIQEEVRNRRFAEVVRIEVHASMPASLRQLLLAEFSEQQEAPARPLITDDLYEVPGLLDAADLLSLATLDLPELKDPPFHPGTQPRLAAPRNIFDVIREGDILLHHPYDSFATSVERFIQTAADDPDVLAIKLTLYRTGGRLQHRAGAGARRRAGQAGGGADRAAGAVRRGEQHHLGPAPGGRRRPRELRGRRAQDPRQGGSGGAAGRRHHAPLPPHRHRQLQPQDRPDLRRLRNPDRQRRAGRRPDRPVQRPHRLRVAHRLPQAHRGAARDAGALPRA